MKLRVLAFLLKGRLPPEDWRAAAQQERPVYGKAHGCDACPMRVGGEWEAGAMETLGACSAQTRQRLKTWGCHAAARPCAGMLRVLAATRTRR